MLQILLNTRYVVAYVYKQVEKNKELISLNISY